MRAVAVFPGQREVRLVDHPEPGLPGVNQVKVRSIEIGICGTDREICAFDYGTPPAGCEYLILGHESCGEVLEAGKSGGFSPGDIVVAAVRRPCPQQVCRPCRSGLQDFCHTGDFTERGIKAAHGFMAEQFIEEERYLHKVPKNLGDVAVLTEPLTIAEKGLSQAYRAQSRLLDDKMAPENEWGNGLAALVLGAGPIGLLGAMAFVSRGFRTWVYARGPKPNPKAAIAEGAGARYLSAQEVPPERLAESIGKVDLIYEGAGDAGLAFSAVPALAPNGVMILTGIPAGNVVVPWPLADLMRTLVLNNQAIIGTVNADEESFRRALADLAVFSRRWPRAVRGVITGRYTVGDAPRLLRDTPRGIKNLIVF